MNIVALLEELVKGVIEAEEKFYENPKDFYSFESSIKSTAEAFSAGAIGNALDCMNQKIYEDRWRMGKYNVQRNDQRTLITSVGDVTFTSTYYESCKNKGEYHYLLEEILGIDAHERFSEAAEVAVLTEALKNSYADAAKVLPSKQKISKTTVMNKVHQIAEEIPYEIPKEKKQCKYLFVEADEDHVAEQHGRWNKKEENGNFQDKLAYVYEWKQDDPRCKGRKELVNTFYFSGVYAGEKGTEQFWKNVGNFIYDCYDESCLERIYVSGDGAPWIRSGAKYLNALFCIDKFHLMKYINAASNQMLDESGTAKSEIYRLLYERKRKGFKEYVDQMGQSANNEKPIEALRTFVIGNWDAIMRALHDKTVSGCSAESHVSHVLSKRLSSRPMGWSKTGADRMSKLRCYEKNYGEEKIIDLVRYSRKDRKLRRTGTDGVETKEVQLRTICAEHYSQSRSYIDRVQATIPGLTAKKIASIREQIRLI